MTKSGYENPVSLCISMEALGEVLYSHWTDGFSIILKKIYIASQTVLSEKSKLKNQSSAVQSGSGWLCKQSNESQRK